MKKTVFLMFALVGATVMFSMQSCRTNGSEDPSNHFTYNETTYDLGTPGIIYYGSKPVNGVYSHLVAIYTPGIHLNIDSGTVSGKGESVYFYLNSSGADNIAPGTYKINPDPDNEEVYNIQDAGIVFNVNADDENSNQESLYFNTGTITVKEDNGTYEMTWTFEVKSGTKTTGYFKGTFVNANIFSQFEE